MATKVLIATDKPFAPVAVNGIREIVEHKDMNSCYWKNILLRQN